MNDTAKPQSDGTNSISVRIISAALSMSFNSLFNFFFVFVFPLGLHSRFERTANVCAHERYAHTNQPR